MSARDGKVLLEGSLADVGEIKVDGECIMHLPACIMRQREVRCVCAERLLMPFVFGEACHPQNQNHHKLIVADCFFTIESDDAGGKVVLITLAKKSMGYESWEGLLQSEVVNAEVSERVRGHEASQLSGLRQSLFECVFD